MKKALVFEPHDDDLTIGMGGTALKLMDEDWEFKTVQITDGRHGSEELGSEEIKGIRRKEKEEELDYLDIEGISLNYEDGNLWSLMQENREEVVDRMRQEIEDFRPEVVFMPARSEGHPDHRATNLLASRSVHKSNVEPLKVSYLVWELPFLEGENLAEKIVMTEVEDVYSQKLEAIRIHESQVREGRYDEMIENFNSYLGLLYSSYDEGIGKSEVPGIQNPEKINKLEELEFQDVTDLSHGRSTENISL